MSLGAKVTIKVEVSEGVGGDLNTATNKITYEKVTQLLNGTGADQANKAFSDRRSIAASGTDSLDLAGTLVDAFGGTITFTKIKALVLVASEANEENLTVGGNANAFDTPFADASDELVLPPGGSIVLTAPGDGFDVTATTGDVLDVVNTDAVNASDYDVIIIGIAS